MAPENQEDIKKLMTDYNPNRAERRRKPLKPRYTIVDYINVPSNILTKASHKYKKIRKENAERREKRRNATQRARKARKESNSKVS